MPELPEVETTVRGISPVIIGQQVSRVVVRQPQLRWPVPSNMSALMSGQVIDSVSRRAKYMLLSIPSGTAIIHLGMSGSLRIVPSTMPYKKHDHVDLLFANKTSLRLHDPRRFGAFLWTSQPPQQHVLLKNLGPEPLSRSFGAQYLYNKSRNRKVAVKSFIMDSKIVVGVGNIYVNEALFTAGIRPGRYAGRISLQRYVGLVKSIKAVLRRAIKLGGTSLRDFVSSDGQPSYFQLRLNVYGKEGSQCVKCGGKIRCIRLVQRSTFYCANCQK